MKRHNAYALLTSRGLFNGLRCDARSPRSLAPTTGNGSMSWQIQPQVNNKVSGR